MLIFLIPCMTSFIVTFFIIPKIISFSDSGRLVARPGDRHSHVGKVPILGGVGIYAGVLFSLLIWGFSYEEISFIEYTSKFNSLPSILIALSIVFCIGLIDDLLSLSPLKKLLGQIASILCIMFLGNMTIGNMQGVFGIFEIPYFASILFTAFVVWLILKWNEKSEDPGNIKYIILIFYILGLAIGIHLLNLLTLPFIGLIILFNKKEIDFKISKLTEINGKQIYLLFITLLFVAITFFIIYNIIIKGIPQFLSYSGFYPFVFLIALVIGLLVYTISKRMYFPSAILSCLVMILIGYSTYITIFIRASQHPSINENNPDNFKNAISYINREQYGDLGISRGVAGQQAPPSLSHTQAPRQQHHR